MVNCIFYYSENFFKNLKRKIVEEYIGYNLIFMNFKYL